MLDWIFEGIVTWISSVVSDMMDAVSGLFLQALGTDMTAMEEYFPFVSKAFTVRSLAPCANHKNAAKTAADGRKDPAESEKADAYRRCFRWLLYRA